jgi:predicted nucleic acid-binding protein
MGGRHDVITEQRAWIAERKVALANAVPPSMVDGLRHMLAVSIAAGLSVNDAYASVTAAMRALQAPHRPHKKAWLALESGCLWLERERNRVPGGSQ